MNERVPDRTADSGQAESPARALSAREAAAALGVHELTIRRAIIRGALPATKVAGVFQITPAALASYEDQRASSSAPVRRSERGAALIESPAAFPVDFPRPLTPLIGRERELASLVELLGGCACRLVTLTGLGGVGKTRLALGAAEAAATAFEDVRFVDLASVRDPCLVPAAVARQLGMRETGGQLPAAALKQLLRRRQMLLILDNFEQILESGPFVTDLLSACPSLQVLVTSRAHLRVAGEQEFPVAPLELPEAGETTFARTVETAAVRFFVERAQAMDLAFVLTSDNVAAVAEICRRLDGLPLALELAAARMKVLPPAALLSRLGQRLPLLTGGARDTPLRHRGMRETLAWSYDLLAPDQQALFRRLSVFAGGFTLEGAEAVAEEAGDVLDGVGALVDASLVRRLADQALEPRFAMLETVREYAQAQLTANDEIQDARRAHAAYFLSLAERRPFASMQPNGEQWLNCLEAERANFRVALEWFAEAGEPEHGLALAAALGWFWFARCHFREAEEWLARMLERSETAPLAPRASALASLARVVAYQGDVERAKPLHAASLALAEKGGDGPDTIYTLIVLGASANHWRDYKHAESLFGEALARGPSLHDPELEAVIRGEVYANLGVTAQDQGRVAVAAARFEQALEHYRAAGHAQGMVRALRDLGDAARDAGDHQHAVGFYRQCLALASSAGNARVIADALDGIAIAAAAWPQAGRAARLFGAAEALREPAGIAILLVSDRAARERGVAAAARALGAAAFASARAAGRTLTSEQILADAQDTAQLVSSALPAALDAHPALTPRELEVLTRLARRQTDREIAAALFISHRTVETHVSRILAKLGARARADAVAVALETGLLPSLPDSLEASGVL